MDDDAELLRRYVEDGSGAAFAELVQRHLNLVYSVALRQANGDTHLAEDITQMVFTVLARKAAALAKRPVLGGWLYRSAQYAAIDAVRVERRRRAREEAHAVQQSILSGSESPGWEKLRPILDEAISELKERDRDAVVLRFFEGRSFAEVGARLRLSENGARMRVERSLDQLHALLTRRGVHSTTAALAAVLTGQAAVAAPAALASAVSGAALAGAGVAVVGGAGFFATFMTMTKLQIGIASALAVAGVTGFAVQAHTNAELREQLAGLPPPNAEIAALKAENLRLAKIAVEVAELQRDDVELTKLRDHALGLKNRLEQEERVAAKAAAAKLAADASKAQLDLSKLDRAPRLKTRVNPTYPFEMRRAGVSGKVIVEFVIDSKGAVQNAFAVDSSRREFEAAAVEAVSHWEFDPGAKNGRQVNTRMQVPIAFTLTESEGTPGDLTLSEGATAKTPSAP